jgi:maleate isomerase
MVEAMKTLGISSVAVATPYIDSVNVEEKKFIEANGLRVPVIKGMQIIDAEPLRTQTPEAICKLTASLDRDDVDGFFISCTNFRSMEVIERLEKDLGKPVTSSTQATLWGLLRRIDYRGRINGCGRLLRLYRP